jgi:crotonobetainyl-CoA:carnitine CoA-transferase CaiB-like acyl-CoA transferase
MAGPLTGIRVLDLSRVLAGPWAGQILADLGAEVIKVERPGRGDDTRGWGPPYLKDAEGRDTEAAYYLSCNRGKHSVTIDFTRPEGQALVRKLAAQSDVLLENYKVGGLAKYGLGYDDLKAVNPGLIYCSITGFGQTGPYRHRAGYDFLIQGMGGLMSVTGKPDDAPGGEPIKTGVAIIDVFTGVYAAVGVLGALLHKQRTGEGQHIDLALLDVQVATLANIALNYLTTGVSPRRLGNAHPSIVPYEAFATADGHLILAVGNDQQFARFCQVAGRPELAADERFATNAGRVRHREALLPIVRELMRSRASREWLQLLEAAGVPCGPINDLQQVFTDPQVIARGLRLDLPHSLAGSAPGVRNPINYSGTPIDYRQAPPVLGEHTAEVLQRLLDIDDSSIQRLRDGGVI